MFFLKVKWAPIYFYIPSCTWCLLGNGETALCFSFQNSVLLVSAPSQRLVKQPEERRKATAGGRSDAILTSNWKPSHSLFPIKRPCQVKEYEQDGARGEGRVTAVGSKLRESAWKRHSHKEHTVRFREATRLKEKVKRRKADRGEKKHMPDIQQ